MIGPKCVHCKKQLLHHNGKTNACPTGKKHRSIGFTQYSETQKFEGKQPKHQRGSEARKDRVARREVKSHRCCACGTKGTDWNPVDPAHIRTFKVTQSDDPRGMIPLCRECHRLQHESWSDFLTFFPHVEEVIIGNGWEITPCPFQKGKLIFSHPEIK